MEVEHIQRDVIYSKNLSRQSTIFSARPSATVIVRYEFGENTALSTYDVGMVQLGEVEKV